ncbi:hypothetical protein AURDEDRAFT_165108 [Auricularia subglabra TFB-10046 SS5]|nr:hypothetical protein AURDEDRAFT_165108 [Auricularia subglabra TFB-10046 SS5]
MHLRPLNAKRPSDQSGGEPLSAKGAKLARHGATAAAPTTLNHKRNSLRAPTTARRARHARNARVGSRAHEEIIPKARHIIQSTTGFGSANSTSPGGAHKLSTELDALSAEALVADELSILGRIRPELAAANSSDIDVADYSLRFRIDDFRPNHGGVFTPRTQPEAPGVLKGDMSRALDRALAEDPSPAPTAGGASPLAPLESVFSALASGGYANAKRPNVLAYALSRHYPVKRLVLAHLDAPDRAAVRALCAGEKHGYRVSLAQLEFSHFGNPATRVWDEESAADPEPMDGVRAMHARLRAFRELDGQRVFATDAAMQLTEASVLNDDEFWDYYPDAEVSHVDTKTASAYYDLEYKFLRTAVVLWPNIEQGNVMLSHCGAQSIMQHAALTATLSPFALRILTSDLVDHVVDDALQLLEAPDSSWRQLQRRGGKEQLAGVVLRIAACRGMREAWTRVLEACPKVAPASLRPGADPSCRVSRFNIYRPSFSKSAAEF